MKNKKGFLLLEVLMAIVVISGGLIFVGRAFTSASAALELSSRLFMRGLMIEEAIFPYEEKGSVEEYFSARGDFEDYDGYSWDLQSSPLPDAGEDVELVRLKVLHKKDKEDAELVETYLIKRQ